MTDLDLSSNNISDISPLASLANLQRLWLDGNKIEEITVLAGLTGLSYIYLGNNNISDISALANLANPATIYLGNNNISDIESLTLIDRLGVGDCIDLSNNPLSSISLSFYMPQLEVKQVTVYPYLIFGH